MRIAHRKRRFYQLLSDEFDKRGQTPFQSGLSPVANIFRKFSIFPSVIPVSLLQNATARCRI